MFKLCVVFGVLVAVPAALSSCLGNCHDSHIDAVARVVYGEARGETAQGQLAVAYTIVNRAAHAGYPSTISAVLSHTYNGHHDYNTLDVASHDTAWAYAKQHHTTEYTTAVTAAKNALCGCASDPTGCATDYCAYDPCSATNNNKYWLATNKQQIGHHWFVCRVAVG